MAPNFQFDQLEKNYGKHHLKDLHTKALFVFPTHEEVWQHNKGKILETNVKYPIAKVSAICKGQHSKSASSDKCGGLLKTVYLCKTATVMLTTNLCIPYGLFNGSIGTVFDIIYPTGTPPSKCFPSAVMVDFPNYSGPQ